MNIVAIRRYSRVVALLLAAVVCIGTSGIGHSGWDDPGCDPVPVHHDHNAHRFRSGTSPNGAPDHCLFCHSFRLLGNGLVESHVQVSDTSGVAAVRTTGVHLASALLTAGSASRAPPVVLL